MGIHFYPLFISNPFFFCWWSSQFNGTGVLCAGDNVLPGNQDFSIDSAKSCGEMKKILYDGLLGIISSLLLFLTFAFAFQTFIFWSHTGQIHILEDSTTTSECWLQASPVIESLTIHSTMVSGHLLLGVEVCGKTSEFRGHAHYCTSFAVKWAPLLEVMLCGIPWQWIRHSEIERFWF